MDHGFLEPLMVAEATNKPDLYSPFVAFPQSLGLSLIHLCLLEKLESLVLSQWITLHLLKVDVCWFDGLRQGHDSAHAGVHFATAARVKTPRVSVHVNFTDVTLLFFISKAEVHRLSLKTSSSCATECHNKHL